MRTEINGRTYDLRSVLKQEGFKWNPTNKSWYKEHEEITDYRKYRDEYGAYTGVKVKLVDSKYSRDNLYRKVFFEKHKGVFGLYRCAYCGKILRKKNVTIDHVVPISRAADSLRCRFFMRYIGIDNVNSVSNLTPCCKRCNSRKGNKVSLITFLRGCTGQYPIGITIRRICEWVSVFSLILIFISIFSMLGGG